ncbi:MAG: hypothetical protein PHI31_05225 [Desulfuromonadaceae bacterium]|nr:hypothetical protein [Desulfuromonadaceae bacterium]
MITCRHLLILFMLTTVWGCSKAGDNTVILDATGKHPTGWAVATIGGNHPAAFISSPDTCKECHGTDLRGGVSTVSCFSQDRNGITCHAQGPSGHPTGWSSPTAHGTHAKAPAAGADGMMFCAKCHGADYTGGIGKSCMTCHTTAPHPPKPWFGGTYTHKNTNPPTHPLVRCATRTGPTLVLLLQVRCRRHPLSAQADVLTIPSAMDN